MKGYYIVRTTAPGISQSERIALEASYARAVEAVLGGVERTTELCLAAASQDARAWSVQPC